MTDSVRANFAEIEGGDGFVFERFTQDLLESLGWTVIQGAGVGPDGGRDLLMSVVETSSTGRRFTRRFVVQCKHTPSATRALAPRDLGEFHLVPRKHNADGWLLVTSGKLTTEGQSSIDAARRSIPGVEFDCWDAERLRSELAKDATRDVFRQYLPQSYAAAAGILAPSRAERHGVYEEWRTREPRIAKFFAPPDDSDSRLQAIALARNVTIEDVNRMMNDVEAQNEFLAIWERHCARGDVLANPSLLLIGARRIRDLRARDFPADMREHLVANEAMRNVDHRNLLRRYWHELRAFHGNPSDWTAIPVSSDKVYLPPVPLIGAQVALYCESPDGAAAGEFRVDGPETIRFFASNALEFNITRQWPIESPGRTPFECHLRTLPGSDPVTVVFLAFMEVDMQQWNGLV